MQTIKSSLWPQTISTTLVRKILNLPSRKTGPKQINADHNIFITDAGLDGPVVCTFVDDIKIMAPKRSGIIRRVKAELASAFSMVDMGSISFYLRLKVERDPEKRTIKLSQPAYIDKVLARFHLDKVHSVNTPMEESALLQQKTDGKASVSEKERYQGMIGSLMFSIVEMRPDIAFATSVASCYAKNPGHQHTEAVKTILMYMKGSRQRGITYGAQEKLLVEGYSDSDWAGDFESRKSTSGFIFMLNGGPVSWCSERQSTVALYSTEVEYIALTLAAKEATWLRLLLTELGLLQPDQQHALIKVSERNTSVSQIHQDLGIVRGEGSSIESGDNGKGGGQALESGDNKREIVISLKGDNQGSIALAHNPIFHSRTKHIEIQYHYIRDEVATQRIQLSYIPTDEMIANNLTKALTHVKFQRFLEQINMQ